MDWLQKGEGLVKDKINDYTEGMKFPASKDDIVAHAREKNMPKEVIDRLEKLPEKNYNNPDDIITTAIRETL